ncbi:MAG: AraC family transcriptional regulator [Verrucomicrobiota bacterium]
MIELPKDPEIYHWIDTPTPLGTLIYGGIYVTDENWGLRHWRALDFFSFALLLEGGGRYVDSQGAEHEVKKGDCILVEPGYTHQYGCDPGGTWAEVYLCFKGKPFDQWVESGQLKGRHIFHLGNVELWAPRWLRIAQSRPRNHYEAVSVLSEIHLLINQVVSAGHMDRSFEERLEASKQHLQSWPPDNQPDWELIASECGCSYETWRKAFSKHYGISPARFRRTALMRQAGRLMTRSALSNDELAEQFGCCDGFHFSKLFKSVMGITPKEYRLNVLNSVSD